LTRKQEELAFVRENLTSLAKLDLALKGPVGVVDKSVNHASDGEDTSHDGAHTREEVQEGLGCLAVRHSHGRDVKVEEDTLGTSI